MKESSAQGLFWKWGSGMYRLRWFVVAAWVVLFAAMGLFAKEAPNLLKDNGFTPRGSESDIGFAALQQELGFPSSFLTLVYTSDTLDMADPRQTDAIAASLEEVKQLPYVAALELNRTPRLQDKGTIQSFNVTLRLDTDQALDRYPDIRSHIRPPQGMAVYVTGGTAIMYDMQEASRSDIAKSELIGLPIALIVLLIVFGTVIGALLPLVVGVMSVTVTLGITYFVAHGQSLSNFLPNMVTMLGLAVGIDYALFMVSRFREELKRQPSVREAVAMTCQTAGQSIFFSGLAVLIGLCGMLFVDLTIYLSLCIGGVLVVSVSVIVANTLLLALLGLFGHRVNRWRVVPQRLRQVGAGRLWERIAYGVMKRPLLLVLATALVLIAFMTPLGAMKLGVPNAEVLPPAYESRHGADLLDREYDAREASPIEIYVRTEDEVWAASSIREIGAYIEQVRTVAGVKEVRSYLSALGGGVGAEQAAQQLGQEAAKRQLEEQRLAKGHAAFIAVVPETNPDKRDTEKLVERLRALDRGSLQTYVTGATAFRLDILHRIGDGIPYVVGFVMLVTYVVLLVAFRSALLPLKAVLMNLLSLGASLGVVVIVFQYGFLAQALHITSTGYVSATLPVIIFCVVFGISMDYEVFLISRIAEEYDRSGDNERSTAAGLTKTGSLITSAAFILIVVVGSFIFTDIEIIKALGLGLALAVLIDATLVRVVMVPALMKLLGRANWWAPGWLRRRG